MLPAWVEHLQTWQLLAAMAITAALLWSGLELAARAGRHMARHAPRNHRWQPPCPAAAAAGTARKTCWIG